MAIIRELFLVFTFTSISYGTMPWAVLPNNTADLCPSRDICMWKKQREVEYNDRNGLTSCCKDCSCDRSCGKDRTCCFSELDVTNGAILKYKSCLQTNEPELENLDIASRYIRRYLMVDSNPDGGCIEEVSDIPAGQQCGNVSVAWWGNLFPAYSQSKKTIYKNKLCAQCHNATDALVFASSLKDCHLDILNEASSSSIKHLKNIFKHSSSCYVSFTYEDGIESVETSIKAEQCFATVDSCPTNFSVPVDIGQDKDEIEKACVSGLFSPYTTNDAIYSNVFCALCNDNSRFGKILCRDISKDFKSPPGSLSILLAFETIDAIQAISSTKQNDDIEAACHSLNDKVECRRVFCPIGMIWFNGECKFTYEKTVGYRYTMMLSLIPDNDGNIQTTNFHKDITEQNKPVNIQSVWSKKWFIIKLFVKDNTYYSTTSTLVEELIITLEHRPKQINPRLLLQEIKSNLEKSHILLSVGNDTYKYRQNMARFYRLDFYPDLDLYKRRYSIYGATSIENQTIFEKVLKKFVYMDIPSIHFQPNLGQITNTHLCRQIQLTKDEYVMLTPYLVYYKTQNITLLDGQFSTNIDENGEQVVRICLSETDFVLASAAPIPLKITKLVFKLALILGNYLNVVVSKDMIKTFWEDLNTYERDQKIIEKRGENIVLNSA